MDRPHFVEHPDSFQAELSKIVKTVHEAKERLRHLERIEEAAGAAIEAYNYYKNWEGPIEDVWTAMKELMEVYHEED